MTDNNLYASVSLPANRRGTVIKVHQPQGGLPPVYAVETDEGEIITLVEIAEGSLIRCEDYDRLIALTRGIKDGIIGTIDVTTWTDE